MMAIKRVDLAVQACHERSRGRHVAVVCRVCARHIPRAEGIFRDFCVQTQWAVNRFYPPENDVACSHWLR
ncbi:hypothetical protein SUGI_0058830 [Cryptomeria japonica]|nr:hypothetical protein SUGI_0058830 [Cryptomeria japonica]